MRDFITRSTKSKPMTTPRIEIEHIHRWLEANTPDWAKGASAVHHHLGAAEAWLMMLCNGSETVTELRDRIMAAQPKPEPQEAV